MDRLSAQARQAINQQIKALNALLKDPRLTIAEYDELHKQRKELEKQLMNDRNARG